MTERGQAAQSDLSPAQAVIAAFGGIRPMAHALGIAVSTVEGWKERGSIPRGRHAEIAAAAAANKIALDPALLASADRNHAPTIEATATVAEASAPGRAAPEKAPEEAGSGQPAADRPAADRPAAEAAPEAEPEAVPEAGRRPPGWLARLAPQLPAAALGGVLVVAGFLLAMGTSDLWLGPSRTAGADAAALQALSERLDTLEQRPAGEGADSEAVRRLEQELAALRQQVEALPEPGTSAGGDPAALDSLRGELDEVKKSLADLKASITTLPRQEGETSETLAAVKQEQELQGQRLLAAEATLGGLAGRVVALEDKLAQGPGVEAGLAALAVAAANLQDAVLSGRAYAAELRVVRGLTGGDPAYGEPVAALAAWAETGVKTPALLMAEFAPLATAIVRAARAPEEQGLLDEVWEEISNLVTIRPVGEVEGDSAAARVARAESRLAGGDLAAAVQELEGLSGPAAETAAPWLQAAKARLAAAAAAEHLTGLALTGLGRSGPSGG